MDKQLSHKGIELSLLEKTKAQSVHKVINKEFDEQYRKKGGHTIITSKFKISHLQPSTDARTTFSKA